MRALCHPQRVFLDVKLEGTNLGRITIELLPSAAPLGAARFKDLAQGKEGVGYRLSRFNGVFPVRCGVIAACGWQRCQCCKPTR